MASNTAQEAWSKVMQERNTFAKEAKPLFDLHTWKWANEIPSEEDIANTIYSLAWECLREIEKRNLDHACTSTGRLQVRLVKYASGWIGNIELIPVWKSCS